MRPFFFILLVALVLLAAAAPAAAVFMAAGPIDFQALDAAIEAHVSQSTHLRRWPPRSRWWRARVAARWRARRPIRTSCIITL